MKSQEEKVKRLPVIGWREWVALPSLGITQVKAKVDSGARSSSLHAFDVEEFEKEGSQWVRFAVHPRQRSTSETMQCEAPILEKRLVRSSSGKATLRPVIQTVVELRGLQFEVELTLANRDEMGFRMLLGREATRRRFLVDTGGSYYGGKPRKTRMQKKAKRKEAK